MAVVASIFAAAASSAAAQPAVTLDDVRGASAHAAAAWAKSLAYVAEAYEKEAALETEVSALYGAYGIANDEWRAAIDSTISGKPAQLARAADRANDLEKRWLAARERLRLAKRQRLLAQSEAALAEAAYDEASASLDAANRAAAAR